MKKWTIREADQSAAVSPGAVNDELRAQQSSMTTLDRSQLPADFVDAARLEQYALHRCWVAERWGSTGEQTACIDTDILATRSWRAATYQKFAGGWLDGVTSALELTGFKGGNLFIEWSGNAYVFGAIADGAVATFPYAPRYMRLRIIVAGVIVAERRGPAYHEHWRIFGSAVFPPGDHTVQLQWRLIASAPDDTLELSTGENIVQGHIYSQKYLAIGRFR